jgi:hypothetical protein
MRNFTKIRETNKEQRKKARRLSFNLLLLRFPFNLAISSYNTNPSHLSVCLKT